MDTLQNDSPEEWRAVVGAEGFYSASTMGRVRSEPTAAKTAGRQRGRVLCPSEDTKGYLIFRVCLPSGVQWTAKVHRVVAEAFLGPCPAGMQVNHKDGNKKNNRRKTWSTSPAGRTSATGGRTACTRRGPASRTTWPG